MNIELIGINHKTAPISIREQFYLNELQETLLLSELKSNPVVSEAFVISTCNRTEVCLNLIEPGLDTKFIIELICRIKQIRFSEDLLSYFYFYHQKQAVEHIMRVVCGLDSLVPGEKQILGQVKTAFELARGKQFFLKTFNILSNEVLHAGKKARSETQIDHGGSSISWAAIKQAQRSLGSLSGRSVLFIGAGTMSKLAVGQIFDKGFKDVYLMNRTIEHAQILSDKYKGKVVPFCDIKETLAAVDLCVCSASAPHYILDQETVAKSMALRRGSGLLIIDISMPRNVDPKVALVNNVTLYHIDNLREVVEENIQIRKSAIKEVESIIAEKVTAFYDEINKVNQEMVDPAVEPTRLGLNIND